MPITYYIVSLEVPFGFGEKVELDHEHKLWHAGTVPFLRIDLVLYVLPIPDFTTSSGVYFATEALASKLERFRGLRKRNYTLKFDEQMRSWASSRARAFLILFPSRWLANLALMILFILRGNRICWYQKRRFLSSRLSILATFPRSNRSTLQITSWDPAT